MSTVARHIALWQRLRDALRARSAMPPGLPAPKEIAAHAQRVLGTDAVARFLDEYYFEKVYGDGSARLTDEEAERIVASIEAPATPPPESTPKPASPRAPTAAHQPPIDNALEQARRRASEEEQRRAEAAAARAEAERVAEKARAAAEREQQALEVARRAALAPPAETRDPGADVGRCFDRGDEARQAHDYDAAIRYFREAVALDPEFNEAWVNLGHSLAERGDMAAAVGAFTRATLISPNDDEGWFWLGWSLSKVGDRDGAFRAYEHARDLNPTDAMTWNNLGQLHIELEQWTQARTSFERALGLDPDLASSHDGLAHSERRLNSLPRTQSAERRLGPGSTSDDKTPAPRRTQMVIAGVVLAALMVGSIVAQQYFGRTQLPPPRTENPPPPVEHPTPEPAEPPDVHETAHDDADRSATTLAGERFLLTIVDEGVETIAADAALDPDSLTRADVATVRREAGSENQPLLVLEFTEAGASKLAKLSAENETKRWAIAIDGRVITSGVFTTPLSTSLIQISGFASPDDLEALVAKITEAVGQ